MAMPAPRTVPSLRVAAELTAEAPVARPRIPRPEVLSGLGRDLTGHWRFDDGPGSTRATDQTAAGHHCELRGLDPAQAWVPGAVGGALELGFNGWLECPQPAFPRRPSATLTVAAWVRRAGNPEMHHAIAMRAMD